MKQILITSAIALLAITTTAQKQKYLGYTANLLTFQIKELYMLSLSIMEQIPKAL